LELFCTSSSELPIAARNWIFIGGGCGFLHNFLLSIKVGAGEKAQRASQQKYGEMIQKENESEQHLNNNFIIARGGNDLH
jgi:hypothetical protein